MNASPTATYRPDGNGTIPHTGSTIAYDCNSTVLDTPVLEPPHPRPRPTVELMHRVDWRKMRGKAKEVRR